MIKRAFLEALTAFKEIEIQQFLLRNPLKLNKDELRIAANQLNFWQKIRDKVPTWAANTQLIAPAGLSVEQSSSELTARWKASLFKGGKIADLTGGMGIDSYFFSKTFDSVSYIEHQPDLAAAAKHNFEALGATTIQVFNERAEEFIATTSAIFDVIYCDPARRDANQKKVVHISDCEPNLVTFLPQILEKTRYVLIKYSPLLDIKLAISQLQFVKQVMVVAVKNEVKELLFCIEKGHTAAPEIKAIHLLPSETHEFSFHYESEENVQIGYALPNKYLYEPNAAIMKAGGFRSVASKFQLMKLAPNSHLYTNENLIEDFQGRVFSVTRVMKFDKKLITNSLTNNKANISCRNFPFKPDEIKKQLKLKDGGDDYLFFTEDANRNKLVILCQKVTF